MSLPLPIEPLPFVADLDDTSPNYRSGIFASWSSTPVGDFEPDPFPHFEIVEVCP